VIREILIRKHGCQPDTLIFLEDHTLQTSWDNATSAAALEITQTCSSITIAVYTQKSESVSKTADFELRRADGRPILHYVYESSPYSAAPDSMERHDGTAALTYFENKHQRLLKGYYYTGRGRQTFGTMQFHFEKKELRGQYI
jgi:hypothetical protein